MSHANTSRLAASSRFPTILVSSFITYILFCFVPGAVILQNEQQSSAPFREFCTVPTVYTSVRFSAGLACRSSCSAEKLTILWGLLVMYIFNRCVHVINYRGVYASSAPDGPRLPSPCPGKAGNSNFNLQT